MAARANLSVAVRFRMGKNGIILGASKSVDDHPRAQLASDTWGWFVGFIFSVEGGRESGRCGSV